MFVANPLMKLYQFDLQATQFLLVVAVFANTHGWDFCGVVRDRGVIFAVNERRFPLGGDCLFLFLLLFLVSHLTSSDCEAKALRGGILDWVATVAQDCGSMVRTFSHGVGAFHNEIGQFSSLFPH
jgi:hypothetical protein